MKTNHYSGIFYAGCSLLLASSGTFAQLSTVSAEFSGSAIETFEEYSRAQVSDWNYVPLSIFSGLATISGPHAYIWLNGTQLGYPGTFGLGPYNARAHDGNQGYGNSISYGTTTVTFAAPIGAFGGYWGCASTTTPIVFTFYAPSGTLIGTQSVVYSAPNQDGTLQWFGWNSSVPIGRIDYSGTWVVNDSLRLQAVPEPASPVLVSTGVVVLAFARKRWAEQNRCRRRGMAASVPLSRRTSSAPRA